MLFSIIHVTLDISVVTKCGLFYNVYSCVCDVSNIALCVAEMMCLLFVIPYRLTY